jgi:hypothetical protein
MYLRRLNRVLLANSDCVHCFTLSTRRDQPANKSISESIRQWLSHFCSLQLLYFFDIVIFTDIVLVYVSLTLEDDQTLVKLKEGANDTGSDYINASHIQVITEGSA